MTDKIKAEIKRVGDVCDYLLNTQDTMYFRIEDNVALYTVDNIREYALTKEDAQKELRAELDKMGADEISKEVLVEQFGTEPGYCGFIDALTQWLRLSAVLLTLKKLDGE